MPHHFFYISCKKATKDTPAVPEDAEELSYKEICTKDQLQEMTRGPSMSIYLNEILF